MATTQEHEELRFFDPEWYLEQNPEVKALNLDPLTHFTEQGWREGRNPSKHFDVKKYVEQYPEILEVNMHPFWHMKYRLLSDDAVPMQFPEKCQTVVQSVGTNERPKQVKRAVVFAAFMRDGIIAPYILYYLRGLKKISDYIVFIADSPVLPEEVKKLSPFVQYVACERHGAYDFGSYSRGIRHLKEDLGLENIDELVLCNDSCIGPVVPFEDMFQAMDERHINFWGLTANYEIRPHLQSFFLVFRNKILQSQTFLEYFLSISKSVRRSAAILRYELPLMGTLCAAGFTCDSYIPYPTRTQVCKLGLESFNLTKSPCFLLERRSPLLKLRSLYDQTMNFDGFAKTRHLLAKYNPDLARLADTHLEARRRHARTPQKCISQEDYNVLHCLDAELQQYRAKHPAPLPDLPESKIMHRYLDGLRGIEIGASGHNSFGLDKTSAFYANVDYKADHGDFWQQGSSHTPARVHVVAQGDALPFQGASLDYVLSSHALEHFFDPIQAIKEWFRLVKTGGYIALIVPHKERTFDKLRPVTPLQELFDRHEGRCVLADYAYINKETALLGNILPKNCLCYTKNRIIPNGYSSLATDADTSYCHLTVWTTQSFLDLCNAMHWNVVEAHDVDDKMGDGFLYILQK